MLHRNHDSISPTPCTPTADLERKLLKDYGEMPSMAALMMGDKPLVIYTNPETGTFTITFRTPNKLSCILSGGTDFTLLKMGQDT